MNFRPSSSHISLAGYSWMASLNDGNETEKWRNIFFALQFGEKIVMVEKEIDTIASYFEAKKHKTGFSNSGYDWLYLKAFCQFIVHGVSSMVYV